MFNSFKKSSKLQTSTTFYMSRSKVHTKATAAITTDIGKTIRLRYQVSLENHLPKASQHAKITVICPNSTPTLKVKSDEKNASRGKPNSFKADAKPMPCTKPNRKTIAKRPDFRRAEIIFSTAIKTIDNAIIGSIKAGGATMRFFMLNINVKVCATVKAVACHKTSFNFGLSKYNPTTNKMWSSPSGKICR